VLRFESLRRIDKSKLWNLFITAATLGKMLAFPEETGEKSPRLPSPFLPNLRRKLKVESISEFATILRLLLLRARSRLCVEAVDPIEAAPSFEWNQRSPRGRCCLK
jgi:hypothetical protein